MENNKRVGLFLDDVYLPDEIPPYIDAWITVTNTKEFIEYVEKYYETNNTIPPIISFDGCMDVEQEAYMAKKQFGVILYSRFKKDTGLTAAKWLTEFCKQKEIKPDGIKIAIHEPFVQMSGDIEFWFTKGQKDFNPITFNYKWKVKKYITLTIKEI